MSVWAAPIIAATTAVAAPTIATTASAPARARTATRAGPPGRRRPSPSSRRGSAPRPASGLPSRPAATRAAASARSCRSRRRTAAGRSSVTVTAAPLRPAAACRCARRPEVQRAERRPDQQDMPARKPQSPMRLTRNAFLPGRRRRRLLVPEPDEQVGAEADALPADEQHQEVCRQDEQQHERAEQVHVAEEPRVASTRLVHACTRPNRCESAARRRSPPASSPMRADRASASRRHRTIPCRDRWPGAARESSARVSPRAHAGQALRPAAGRARRPTTRTTRRSRRRPSSRTFAARTAGSRPVR